MMRRGFSDNWSMRPPPWSRSRPSRNFTWNKILTCRRKVDFDFPIIPPLPIGLETTNSLRPFLTYSILVSSKVTKYLSRLSFLYNYQPYSVLHRGYAIRKKSRQVISIYSATDIMIPPPRSIPSPSLVHTIVFHDTNPHPTQPSWKKRTIAIHGTSSFYHVVFPRGNNIRITYFFGRWETFV